MSDAEFLELIQVIMDNQKATVTVMQKVADALTGLSDRIDELERKIGLLERPSSD
jgi:phage shock protein A